MWLALGRPLGLAARRLVGVWCQCLQTVARLLVRDTPDDKQDTQRRPSPVRTCAQLHSKADPGR